MPGEQSSQHQRQLRDPERNEEEPAARVRIQHYLRGLQQLQALQRAHGRHSRLQPRPHRIPAHNGPRHLPRHLPALRHLHGLHRPHPPERQARQGARVVPATRLRRRDPLQRWVIW